jgi:hypothetical protein
MEEKASSIIRMPSLDSFTEDDMIIPARQNPRIIGLEIPKDAKPGKTLSSLTVSADFLFKEDRGQKQKIRWTDGSRVAEIGNSREHRVHRGPRSRAGIALELSKDPNPGDDSASLPTKPVRLLSPNDILMEPPMKPKRQATNEFVNTERFSPAVKPQRQVTEELISSPQPGDVCPPTIPVRQTTDVGNPLHAKTVPLSLPSKTGLSLIDED